MTNERSKDEGLGIIANIQQSFCRLLNEIVALKRLRELLSKPRKDGLDGPPVSKGGMR